MASYSNGSVIIHGNGVNGYGDRPIITISLTVGNITRSGNTLSASVSASINGLGGYSYFGYNLNVSAQLDDGGVSVLFSKPNYPSQWSSGAYSGSTTVSSTNATTSCRFKILLNSICGCSSSPHNSVVFYVDLSAPSANKTVTFDLKGGTRTGGGNLTQSVAVGGSATAPTCTREGYNFAGWDKGFTNVQSDITVNAKWSIKTYSVTYNANGGTGAPGGQTKTWGVNLTLSKLTPKRDGHIFKGWATSASGGVAYGAGGTYSANAAVTLYAVWEIITYSVTYHANGGSGAPANQTKVWGTTLKLTTSTPSTPKRWTVTFNPNGGTVNPATKVVNCSFKNWNTKPDGSGTAYSSGANYTGNAALILYAQWTNNAIGTLPTPSRSNCIFVAWYTQLSGGSKLETTTVIGSNITYYARYNYYIRYNANGGEIDPPTAVKQHDVALKVTSITPYNYGKKFLGWSENKSAASATYSPGSNYTTNAPTTLYAIWGVATYTVTFVNGYNGGVLKTQKVEFGKNATPPADPERNGYKFLGWLGKYTAIDSDRTIKAIWDFVPLWRMNSKHQWEKFF